MTDTGNELPNRFYELGAALLAAATIYLSFSAGRILGFKGAELAGYSVGAPLTALIIVTVCQLMKRARTRRAISKIAFFTMLVFLFGTAGSLLQATAKRSAISTEIDPAISTEIDPASLNVNQQQAISLALRIEDSVRQQQPYNINAIYDAERFVKNALRGEDAKSSHLQDVAIGGGEAFAKNRILEQMASLANDDGDFTFVKFYRRDGEPILQFRVNDGSGGLHYVDFYLFKTVDDIIRIGDLRYYNSGDRLSKQTIASATNLDGSKSGIQAVDLQAFQDAMKLAQQGKAQEAQALVESLPEDTKQLKVVMRFRLQLAYRAESSQADQLFNEFKERFPDDPSIVFSVLVQATARDDLGAAAAVLDEIYQVVEGDEYLLWYKVQLFVAEKNYRKAITTLSEMETKYGVDVLSSVNDQLSEEFRSSKEYRAWLREHERRQGV